LQRNIFRAYVKLSGWVSDNEGTKYEFSDLNGVLELFSYRG